VQNPRPTAKHKSLRGKFVRILLFVSVLIGISTLATVVFLNAQSSAFELAQVEGHIQEGLSSKGKVLTQNHAIALRGLTLDNAFLDMQKLVEQAVHDEQDLVYGIFVNSEREALAASKRGDKVGSDEPPAKDAWRALGLDERKLLVKKIEVERTTRLGQDLLEVAAPVTSEEGEALGTVRYGLSLSRMHQALDRAQHDSRARLWRTVFWIGALVTAMTVLGLLLSRTQAVKVTEPVEALTRAAEELASGNRSVRVSIGSGDELEMLGSSFNRMVEELDGSYRALEQMNRTLEHKVEVRTLELAVKNRDMQLVLDNVDQGFVTLSPQGVMLGERSRVVTEWFGASTGPVAFWEYVSGASRAFAVALRLGWAQMEEGFLPLEVCITQLPERLTNGIRTWSFRYLPFFKDSEIEGILVVIADVTEQLAREREDAEQTELMQGFKKLMLDRSGFTSFLREAGAMVEEVTSRRSDGDVGALKRTLHTLKGSSGMMGLTVVARLCHTLEDQLAEEGAMQDASVRDLASRWAAIGDHVARFAGTGAQRVIEIPESEYTALVSRLSRNEKQEDVLHQVLSWQLEPASRSLHRLGDQAKALSRRLGKGDLDVEVIGSSVRLDPDVWGAFFNELSHVVRNAVDHGFEPVEERRTTGKTLRHTLLLRAEITADALTFEVTDDGRGIDWNGIKESAKARGLPHATQAQLLTALCSDGVTTRDGVTDISGRGVGMAAFRRRVEAQRGRIEVRSSPGAGTSWFIRFPWPSDSGVRGSVGGPSSPPSRGATGT
jgi:HPt (histidine-containing phosphotransfer) domain-containing protein/HAMP domain-containing protein